MLIGKYSRLFVFVIIIIGCFFTTACTIHEEKDNLLKNTETDIKIRIGFSMDTLKEERWQRDRDIFVAKAKELNAEVIVQNANNDSDEQMQQAKYLLQQDIDVLVIIPHDADKASAIVQMAKKSGVKVISYDRLVRKANVDMYISFDNIKVGETMAQYLINKVPGGNFIIINGANTDYNSHMYNQGYKNILKSYTEDGSIRVLSEIWTEDWMPEEAFKCVENNLQSGKKIDGIIAANDSLAGAAIEALSEKRLSGIVKVVGDDADLAGCQRVVEGTQLMTVYKPIQNMAQTAADIAVRMAKGEDVKANSSISDGKYTVPYYMIKPIPVTSQNMMETVIKDGFHRIEDVYRNIPRAQWPEVN